MCGFPKVNRRGMFSYDGGPVTSRSQLKRQGVGGISLSPSPSSALEAKSPVIINNAKSVFVYGVTGFYTCADFMIYIHLRGKSCSFWPATYLCASSARARYWNNYYIPKSEMNNMKRNFKYFHFFSDFTKQFLLCRKFKRGRRVEFQRCEQ